MESSTINKPYSFIRQITEIGVTTLISAYFFTAGYINSFSLPIKVDFFTAGYFLITLLADSVPTLLFNVLTGILKLPIHIFVFFNNLPTNFYILYKIILAPLVENRTFLIVVITTIVFASIVFFIRLRFSNFLRKILTPFMFLWKKIKLICSSFQFLIQPPFRFPVFYMLYIMFIKLVFDFEDLKLLTFSIFSSIQKDLGLCRHIAGMGEEKISCIMASNFLYSLEFYINNVIKVFFVLTLLFVVFSVPLFVILNFKANDSFKFKNKKTISFILVVLLSMSFSYYLGRVYLGKFIDYPIYRSDITKIEQRVQIWRDRNDYFYVECKETSSSLIKGANTQTKEVFYISYLDKFAHPNLCPKSKKKRNTTFKDKVIYPECYYKNDKNEILIADFCVANYGYVVVSPKGFISHCYIHTSQIVDFSTGKANPAKYYANEEDIKRYEDNYKHTPIRKKKNPLSNPGFAIEEYTKKYMHSIPEGTHKTLIQFNETFMIMEVTISKRIFGHKIEKHSMHPFKDIKKHFPKCD